MVDTVHRRLLPDPVYSKGIYRLSSVAAAIVLLLVLGGCATGKVEEARRAETREATRGAVLPEVQATKIVEEFFPPTGTPEATRTPIPTLATLTLATRIGSDNQPLDEVGSIARGQSVYAVAEIYTLASGQTVTAIWTTADGAEITRSSINVDQSLAAAWVPFKWDVAGVGAGSYAVYIYVDDVLLNSLVFTVF